MVQLGRVAAAARAWASDLLASKEQRAAQRRGRRRAALLWGLLVVALWGAAWGLGGQLVGAGAAWWRAPFVGLSLSVVVGVALGAPAGDADWTQALLGCVALVTLWESALLVVGQQSALLLPYAAWLLRITLLAQATGLVMAFLLAMLAGLFDTRAAILTGLLVGIIAGLSGSVGLGAAAGLLVGLALAPARGGLARVGATLWGAAAIAILALMNWRAMRGAPGLAILGVGLFQTICARSRWRAAYLAAWLAWAVLVAQGLPSLMAYALSGATALVALGQARRFLGGCSYGCAERLRQ